MPNRRATKIVQIGIHRHCVTRLTVFNTSSGCSTVIVRDQRSMAVRQASEGWKVDVPEGQVGSRRLTQNYIHRNRAWIASIFITISNLPAILASYGVRSTSRAPTSWRALSTVGPVVPFLLQSSIVSQTVGSAWCDRLDLHAARQN